MIKQFVTDIGGIETFGIISICLFTAVFAGALLWACALKKNFVKQMSNLPLHDGEVAATEKGVSHE